MSCPPQLQRSTSRRLRALSWVVGFLSVTSVAHAVEHTVTQGDSLWSLARKYGVSVEALQARNQLGAQARIRTGQQLQIPSAATAAATPTTTKADAAKPAAAKVGAAPTPPKADAAKPAAAKAGAATPGSNAEPKPTVAISVAEARKVMLNEPDAVARIEPQAAVAKAETALPPISNQARARAEKLYQEPAQVQVNTLDEVAPEWVLKPPSADTQGEKPNAQRGGFYPCAAPDPGFGDYRKWIQVAPMAHVLAPRRLTLDADASFDLVIHFHGREPIRKEWVRVMHNTVLVAVDIGIDSGAYRAAFRDPRTIGQVVLAAEREIANQTGQTAAHVRHVGLSAWSAGYGAVEAILSQPYGRSKVDSVVLLDGLHAGYAARSLNAERLTPFVEFAQAAATGHRLMFVSHSSLRTHGYASTTETANYLIWKLNGKPQAAIAATGYPMGLERITSFNQGDFHVRGFRGSGSADHCAHIGLMRDVLRVYLKGRYEPTPSVVENGAIASRDAIPESR